MFALLTKSNAVRIVDSPQVVGSGPWQVPVEFSFGFFRFGHSMIRSTYAFNSKTLDDKRFDIWNILHHTSEQDPLSMPFEDKWTIDWRQFFGSDPTKTNFSVMIGPWSRFDLENAVRGPDVDEPGLTARDLTSSIATQPWSVRALAQALIPNACEICSALVALSGWRSERPAQSALANGAIHDWLKQRRAQGGDNFGATMI